MRATFVFAISMGFVSSIQAQERMVPLPNINFIIYCTYKSSAYGIPTGSLPDTFLKLCLNTQIKARKDLEKIWETLPKRTRETCSKRDTSFDGYHYVKIKRCVDKHARNLGD
jgi:hypothetical protein